MSLRVDLDGNGSGFKQMLDTAKTQTKAFSNSVTAEIGASWGGIGKTMATSLAGMFTIGGIKSGVDWFINTGKEIKETAEQVDMSTDSWQKWADAVEQAGLSTSSFMRIVEALRQKRTDAMTDPKARGELNRIGFTDADITGDMDMSEFTRRALMNSKGGDEQRKYLADIIGARGIKYGTALDKLPGAKAPFSPDDLQTAEDYAAYEKQLGKFAETEIVGVNRLAHDRNYQKAFGLVVLRWWQAILGRGRLWNRGASITDGVWETENGLNGFKPAVPMRDGKPLTPEETAKANAAGGNGLPSTEKPKADPFDAVLAQQTEQLALKKQDRDRQLVESERGLMTIGDRRASTQKTLADLEKTIAERNQKLRDDDVGYLSESQKIQAKGLRGKALKLFLREARDKFDDETNRLQVEANRERGELKEKPLSYNTDSMSKVGLYSASQVALNPLLGVAQRQLEALNKLVINTAPHGRAPGGRDSHAP